MRSVLSLLAFVPLILAAPAPILKPRAGQAIPGKYIVVMKPTAKPTALSALLDKIDGTPDHVFDLAKFKGISGNIGSSLLTIIKNMAEVDYIEQDAVVTTTVKTTQAGAPLGLGRISHKARGSTSYVYDNSAGSGTCSYIIDTGIYTAHPDFEGRATFLANYAGDGLNDDGNGHGTHVAGVHYPFQIAHGTIQLTGKQAPLVRRLMALPRRPSFMPLRCLTALAQVRHTPPLPHH